MFGTVTSGAEPSRRVFARTGRRLSLAAATLVLIAASALTPALAQSIALARTIPLADVGGRLDHMDVDVAGGRLFLAALAAGSLEIVDLNAGKRVDRITRLAEPQGAVYLGAMRRLVVASGGSGRVDAYDKISPATAASVAGLDDADNLRFDAAAGQVLVGYGHGLAFLDAQTLRVVQVVPLPGHPEAFEIEGGGRYVFVNVPSASLIAVVDRRSDKIAGTWTVGGAAGNFAMALDGASNRLFVATRRPAMLLVYDTATGKRTAELPLCSDADDLFFDPPRRQLYAVCGQGVVDVVRQRDADHYEMAERLQTSPGARTGLFVARLSTLFVAVPAHAGASAEIRAYRVQ